MSRRERTRAPAHPIVAGVLAAAAGVSLIGLLLGGAGAADAKKRSEPSGRELYLAACARCHGLEGRGDGPDAVFFSPRPRDLTTGFLAKYQTEELVARVRDGTPLRIEIDREAMRSRLRNVEEIVAHLQRLPDVDWKKVDAGALVYADRCEACHGPFGQPWPEEVLPRGVRKPPRDLRDPALQRSLSDAALKRTFRQGHADMPAVVKPLPEAQARDLVAFLRLLSPGFETYSYYCAPCHGDDGRGRGILATGENEPDVAFDAPYLDEKDEEDLRVGVWHMLEGNAAMPHFRDVLEDEQLEAILESLQRRAK